MSICQFIVVGRSGDGGDNIISKPRTKVRAESLNLLKQVVIFGDDKKRDRHQH
ncbi:hypothetical protein H6G81_27650 [Scytonema hofmannii FACHB-248]|uniref:Uncharacterized protein n=1 Tax=Scytonema hofmannii FACHB-248 TaxID=1842502 RepID=A0ABR8GYE3_9CYAN|nr:MULTISPECIES: hypothetical protein [Nostocales]MBD2608187.1 hypothetical protein [Scytonema hofmannii FACHB-248]